MDRHRHDVCVCGVTVRWSFACERRPRRWRSLGSVECPSGQAVQGVWVESSGGGSRWADWTAYPKRRRSPVSTRRSRPTSQPSSRSVLARRWWADRPGLLGHGQDPGRECSGISVATAMEHAPTIRWRTTSRPHRPRTGSTSRSAPPGPRTSRSEMTGRYPNWRGADGARRRSQSVGRTGGGDRLEAQKRAAAGLSRGVAREHDQGRGWVTSGT